MLAGAHAVVGASIMKAGGSKWPYTIPLIIYSHGLLDASNIYHETDAISFTASGICLVLLGRYCWGYWPGMLLACSPDIEWVIKSLFLIPHHPILWWQPHGLLQYWPSWNWHGLYGAHWGMAVEIGLMGVLLWYLVRRGK